MSKAIPMNPPAEVETVETVTTITTETIDNSEKQHEVTPEWVKNIFDSSLRFPQIIIHDTTGLPVEVIALSNIKLYRGKIKEITISYNKENQEPKLYTFELKK